MSDDIADAGAGDQDWVNLREHLDRSYLEYALSVVKGRAIPDVRDGLKPVQRRVLYAMHRLGLGANHEHKKSARVVGEVIGKFHPHGDQAAYDALVRLAQDFTMRYPLVDGQGNFGTADGDNPAAMRYTEARLHPFADLLLSETDQGTVAFLDNYDGAETEPEVLPARVPMPLLNPQPGIAVGLATDIPGHNLVEAGRAAIRLLQNPAADTAELMADIQGPDFPQGGQICAAPADIRAIYEAGSGTLTVRARYAVEHLAGGDWQIAITELPPDVSAEQVLADIDALANPQPKKGKKDISSEQKALRQRILALVGEISNQAGQDTGPVRLVITPKTKRVGPDDLMGFLMGHTSLEIRKKVSLTYIDTDGRPKEMALRDVLASWTAFRRETVTARTRHRLGKVDHRIHILEGRQAVLLDIDRVIAIVRNSEDDQEAKTSIIAEFELTETQADDVLDIPLRRLTKLDQHKITDELGNLREEKAELEHRLADPDAMTARIVEELEADIAKFGDARRSLIEEAEPVAAEAPVVDEPVTVLLSEKGFLRSRQGHNLDLSSVPHKDGDGPLAAVETRTTRSVVVLDAGGRAYTVAANDAPGGKGYGTPLTTLVDLQNPGLVGMVAGDPEDRFLLATTAGNGFVTRLKDLMGRTRNGKTVVKGLDGAGPLPPQPVDPAADRIAVVSDSGYLVVFGADEVKEIPAGKGVKLMAIKAGERLARVQPFREALELPGKGGRGVQVQGEELTAYERRRGSRGRPVPERVVKGRL